jgi:fluoroquinolone resistance protein
MGTALRRGLVNQLEQSDIAELAPEADLQGLSFDGLSLVGFDFSGRNIVDCSFRDCVLTDSRFNTSTIRACEFAGAGIQGVSLFASVIEECKMMGLNFARGVRFDATTFKKTNLDYSLFRGADLSDLEFNGCSMRECDLTGANLEKASLIECDLTDADWSEVRTYSTDLRGSRVRGLDLRTGPHGVILTSRQVLMLAEDIGVTVIDPAE